MVGNKTAFITANHRRLHRPFDGNDGGRALVKTQEWGGENSTK